MIYIQNIFEQYNKAIVNWKYLKIKLELKYGKYLEYYLKQNVHIKHYFLLNSANDALLLSTIWDSYAKIRNQDIAGLYLHRIG